MAKQTVNDQDSGLLSRTKINENFSESYGQTINAFSQGASPGSTAAVNTAAFQAAFNAESSVGISPGTYLLNARLTVSEKSFNLIGAGIGQTILKWEVGSATTGILITESVDDYFVNISGLSLVTEKAGLGAAISIVRSGEESGGVVQNRVNPRVSISDVFTAGATSQGIDGWLVGINLTDVMHATIDRHHNIGYMPVAATPTSSAGINIDGDFSPVEIIISNSWGFAAINAVLAQGSVEGLYVDNCIFVDNNYGVWHASDTSDPQLLITNSHISSHLACVRMVNINQSNISGNLFYHRENSIADGIGVWSTNGTWNKHTNNTFVKTSGGGFSFTGILLDGTETGSTVDNNTFQVATLGISLGASTLAIRRSRNVFGTVTTPVTHLGDNYIPVGHRAIIGLSAPFPVPTATTTEIIWDNSVNSDLPGFTSPSTDWVAPFGATRVDINCGIVWSPSSVGERRASIYKNGAILVRSHEDVSAASGESKTGLSARGVEMAEGDTISVAVYQDTGGSLSVTQSVSSFMQIIVAHRDE